MVVAFIIIEKTLFNGKPISRCGVAPFLCILVALSSVAKPFEKRFNRLSHLKKDWSKEMIVKVNQNRMIVSP